VEAEVEVEVDRMSLFFFSLFFCWALLFADVAAVFFFGDDLAVMLFFA